ncbi:DNA translocase FtsK [Escherichia coli]|nr:DNA translocase FtsK [Escherichia coli]
MQYNEPLQQPVQPQQPYYAPAAEQPAQQPYYAPAAEQPVQQPYYATAAEQSAQQPYYAPAPEQTAAGNAWQAEEQQSTFAPQSTYQTEQTYQQPAAQEPLYQQPQPVEQQPVVEPELVVEETKPARPPLYYFEEVEKKRAREREQLAAWYQPIPEPVKEPEPIKSSPLKHLPCCRSTHPIDIRAVSPLASGVKKRPLAAEVPQPLLFFSLQSGSDSGGSRHATESKRLFGYHQPKQYP